MQINSKIHFIGISGIGMSGIAELMLDKGYSIQGSDISVNDNTKRLKKKGIKFFLGHNKKNIKNAHAIVYSSAIKKNNPEIREAYIKKIPVLSRADMLSLFSIFIFLLKPIFSKNSIWFFFPIKVAI